MASHLTLEEREIIAHMHRAGKMQTQIADRPVWRSHHPGRLR
jgi:IS30 family transposase